MSTLPYSDELMTFDEATKHYILTEKALEMNGMALRRRLSLRRGAPVSEIINRLLRRVSDIVYNYIHKFNVANKLQDEIIAQYESARSIIYRAMLEQTEYVLLNGDLSRSVEKDKRAIAIDYSVVETLNTVIPEFAVPITYTGYLGG
jgi:hypothetical protein